MSNETTPTPQDQQAEAWHPEDGPNPACAKCGYFKDSTGGCMCGHVPLGEAMALAHPAPQAEAAPSRDQALREAAQRAVDEWADHLEDGDPVPTWVAPLAAALGDRT